MDFLLFYSFSSYFFLKRKWAGLSIGQEIEGVYMALGWTFAKKKNLDQILKKLIFILLFQWPTTTLTNPSSVLVPWPLRLTSCRRRAPTPVPTTLTKWLLSLFRISTIRVSLWGSRSESHHKNWINGIWCLIIHAIFFCHVLFLP